MMNSSPKLEVVRKVFNIDAVLALPITKDYIARYYRINQIPYSIFHTRTDLMYMGISRDGLYKEDDLLEAARTINKYIISEQVSSVLELATGRGATSFWLAVQNPKVSFHGIDISEGQLAYARKRANQVKNYFPIKGDYHNLSYYPDHTFDIVFEIEALCYSTDKDRVLCEVKRVLKQNGLFILFDGYRKKLEQNPTEQITSRLVEKGMALERFEQYEDFKSSALNADFSLESEEDVSGYILPTMARFERLAKKFFSFPKIILRFLKFVLPKEFLYNTISGYLGADLVRSGVFGYMITILRKRKERACR